MQSDYSDVVNDLFSVILGMRTVSGNDKEQFAEPEILPQVLDIVDRQIKNCDNDEVLELAKQLRNIVIKAIEVSSPVGFCF